MPLQPSCGPPAAFTELMITGAAAAGGARCFAVCAHEIAAHFFNENVHAAKSERSSVVGEE